MRPMPPRFVEIVNTSDEPREIRDPSIGPYPDDRVTLAPKETRRLPVAAFLRLQRLPFLMRAERYEAMQRRPRRKRRDDESQLQLPGIR